jgi:putative endonuclease
MTEKKALGNKGEVLAKNFLIGKGYKILEENFRFKRSEIDLIVIKENELVFVEVKTKSYNAFGEPEIAVTRRKAMKVFSAANHYIFKIGWKKMVRFDVVAIIVDKIKDEIEIAHFEDAFY